MRSRRPVSIPKRSCTDAYTKTCPRDGADRSVAGGRQEVRTGGACVYLGVVGCVQARPGAFLLGPVVCPRGRRRLCGELGALRGVSAGAKGQGDGAGACRTQAEPSAGSAAATAASRG